MKIKLDDIEKKAPYSIPSDYFEVLTAKVQSKIEKRRTTTYSVQWNWKLAIATTFVITIALFLWTIPSLDSDKTQDLLTEVSDDDILDYLAQNELDDLELLSLSNAPEELLKESPSYLNGIDLGDGSIEELLEKFDLNDTYF